MRMSPWCTLPATDLFGGSRLEQSRRVIYTGSRPQASRGPRGCKQRKPPQVPWRHRLSHLSRAVSQRPSTLLGGHRSWRLFSSVNTSLMSRQLGFSHSNRPSAEYLQSTLKAQYTWSCLPSGFHQEPRSTLQEACLQRFC